MNPSKTTHITPIGGNIFLDLGFDTEEAAKLKADSDILIQTKRQLAKTVGDWINENQLKQEQAAQILGVSRPRVSDVMNQKISKFTIDALISMIVKTGKTVQFEVR